MVIPSVLSRKVALRIVNNKDFLGFLVFLGLFLWQCSKTVSYICLLSRQIQDMEGGDLEFRVTRRGNNELTRLADSLDSMRISFAQQRVKETALFQAHQKMVTQMSHDLRTPLTSLQIYMDILLYKNAVPKKMQNISNEWTRNSTN